MSKSHRKSRVPVLTTATFVLGLVTLTIATVALVYHYVNERSFYKKWSAFQEDGFLN